MDKLEKIFNYHFKNKEYLHLALTHKSYINEQKEDFNECNERLEFLGDSILDAVTAEYMYNTFPTKTEGAMTKIRSVVVCEDGLAKIARKWNLGEYLILSNGEEINGGRTRNSILSDAVESVIAAVFLDGGYDEAKKLILSVFADEITNTQTEDAFNSDYKTTLQEYCHKRGYDISYKLIKSKGPDHCKTYEVCAVIRGKMFESACGTSKKRAEQKAAQVAFKAITSEKKEV